MNLQTPLYAMHVELGARMVEFAGYDMPVQYPEGIIAEHLHTRRHAGLFDVSHMGQLMVSGVGSTAALEGLMPADLQALMPGRQVYSVLTNESGGIHDDLMVTRLADESFLLVVNAGNKQRITDYLVSHLGGVSVKALTDRALFALQGPGAEKVLAGHLPGVEALIHLGGMHCVLDGNDCYISRSGYTGEDGFEISLPGASAEPFARRLLADGRVRPVGLGARDSLRLEAGMCLYGHDLDSETTPIEAGIRYVVAPVRRPGGRREGGYPGEAVIARQLTGGAERLRVGLLGESKAPVREGSELHDENGRRVGIVTSGGYGPTVEGVIAMGYVERALALPGTPLQAMVRGKPRPMQVCRMPFVAPSYRRA